MALNVYVENGMSDDWFQYNILMLSNGQCFLSAKREYYFNKKIPSKVINDQIYDKKFPETMHMKLNAMISRLMGWINSFLPIHKLNFIFLVAITLSPFERRMIHA